MLKNLPLVTLPLGLQMLATNTDPRYPRIRMVPYHGRVVDRGKLDHFRMATGVVNEPRG
jgi:hypothetical protein